MKEILTKLSIGKIDSVASVAANFYWRHVLFFIFETTLFDRRSVGITLDITVIKLVPSYMLERCRRVHGLTVAKNARHVARTIVFL